MAIIGLIHITSITTSPASNQTPAASIISHLSDLYPTQSHQPFNLDHRLFVSTSSLLPNIDGKRTFVHLFTSSHSPQRTFVSTTSSNSSPLSAGAPTEVISVGVENTLSTITIPTNTSLEALTTLINQKLQPQWAARQFLTLDNGISVELPLKDDARWEISVGDLRLAPSRASGSAAGQLRGIVLEVWYKGLRDADLSDLQQENTKRQYETLFRALLKGLFRGLKLDLKLNDVKIHLAQCADAGLVNIAPEQARDDSTKQSPSVKPRGYEIAELYMEVLRGPKG